MTELLPDIWAVEVPDDAKGFDIWEATMSLRGYKKGDLFLGYIHNGESYNEPLPSGNWSILFSTKDAGEEDWATAFSDSCDYTSKECGIDILTSKGLDPNKNYVLIKKV